SIDIVTFDAALVGDTFGGGELVTHVDRPVVRIGVAGARGVCLTEEHPAHHLDAASDSGVDLPGRDQSGHHMDRLLRRTACAVDGGRGGRVRETCVEPGLAGHVVGLLPRLGHGAPDELTDLVGRQSGAVENGLLGGTEQHRGVDPGQLSATTTDRCPRGLHDDDVPHAYSQLSTLLKFILVTVIAVSRTVPPSGTGLAECGLRESPVSAYRRADRPAEGRTRRADRTRPRGSISAR